jgi:hypothetical protein
LAKLPQAASDSILRLRRKVGIEATELEGGEDEVRCEVMRRAAASEPREVARWSSLA